MTKKEMVERAMTSVMLAQEHRKAVHAAVHFVRRDGHSELGVPPELDAALWRAEAEAWSTLLMWGLVADESMQDRIKAAAYAHFLADRTSVKQYLDTDNTGGWLHSDEVAFREMARKAFAPREKP
jgi:hypothetical protein